MEYIQGTSLRKFLDTRKKLSITDTLSIAKQVCLGLDHMHSLQVIHRDIKPSNLMIFEDSGVIKVKIVDLGLAIVDNYDERIGLTAAGNIKGTPPYMSPEQLGGEVLDERTDIYSFGVVMYEMITGFNPFSQGYSPFAVLCKEVSPVKELNPEVPALISSAIMKAIKKDRNERFSNIKELQQLLFGEVTEKVDYRLDSSETACSDYT